MQQHLLRHLQHKDMVVGKSQVNKEQDKGEEERGKKPCDNTSPEVVAPKIPSFLTWIQKELSKEKLDYPDTSSLMDSLDFTPPFAKTPSGDGDSALALPQAPSAPALPPSTEASTSFRPPSTETSASLLLPRPPSTGSGHHSMDDLYTHMLNLEAECRDSHHKLLAHKLMAQFDASKRFNPCWQVMEDSSIATPGVPGEIYRHCIPAKDLVGFINKDPCALSDIFSTGFLQAGAAFRAALLQNLYWRHEKGTAQCPLMEAPPEQFQSHIKLEEVCQKLKLVVQEIEEAVKALQEEKTREEWSVKKLAEQARLELHKACEEARRKGRIDGEKEVLRKFREKLIHDLMASNGFKIIIERRACIMALKFISNLLPQCETEYKNELLRNAELVEKAERTEKLEDDLCNEFEFEQLVISMYENESM